MSDDIVEVRAADYGDPVANHERIARMWTGYLGFDVSAHDVAMMFILAKVSRMKVTPGHADSITDIDGYARIAGKIAARG